MASQTVDTNFWSQKANSNIFCFGCENFFMTSSLLVFFCNQKYICAFIVFASYLSLIVCCKVFLIGKFGKIRKFNRVRALILSPSNDFLTSVCLSYRACLQWPTYQCILSNVYSWASAFLIRSIYGLRAFLLSYMSGRRAFLTRSWNGFYLWQGWCPGLHLNKLSLGW